MLVKPEADASAIAGSMMKNMGALWMQADIKRHKEMLSPMPDAVLLDPNRKSMVGRLPKPAFREIVLNVEPSNGVTIFDPDKTSQKEADASFRIRKDTSASNVSVWWRRGRVELGLEHGLTVLVATASSRYYPTNPSSAGTWG